MTIKEFSDEFDTLYNNIMSNQAPGIDEYEKSVFLTRAQEEIIKNYFNIACFYFIYFNYSLQSSGKL